MNERPQAPVAGNEPRTGDELARMAGWLRGKADRIERWLEEDAEADEAADEFTIEQNRSAVTTLRDAADIVDLDRMSERKDH